MDFQTLSRPGNQLESLGAIPSRRRAFTDCFELKSAHQKEHLKTCIEKFSESSSDQDSEYVTRNGNRKRLAKEIRKNDFKEAKMGDLIKSSESQLRYEMPPHLY
jgi:hypothetical protein